MCGITGFLSENGNLISFENEIKLMTSKLYKRGPDDFGTWIDFENKIAFGHQRLSILDLTKEGHQPMLSKSERYVLIFNGEIYNHKELRYELNNNENIIWKGESDTETMLVCIEKWGLLVTLKKCIGMFAIALWDCKTKILSLARDRIGEKPLYYGWQGGAFLFGSELKSLRCHSEFNPEIDREALDLFMRFSYVPTPYSIYKNIYKFNN